jgi:hypothetical protein
LLGRGSGGCSEFAAQHRTHPKHFTRQRHLTFRHLILFLHKTWQGLPVIVQTFGGN